MPPRREVFVDVEPAVLGNAILDILGRQVADIDLRTGAPHAGTRYAAAVVTSHAPPGLDAELLVVLPGEGEIGAVVVAREGEDELSIAVDADTLPAILRLLADHVGGD